MSDLVYQFRIALKGISPTIWRRIHVPEQYNFWDLHVAIQDSMGWLDYHLHVFRIRRKHAHSTTEIGIPDEDRFDDAPEILPGWEIPLSAYFTVVGTAGEYVYDFGDDWEHEVLLEGVLLKNTKQKYPHCIGGERACPPEDCGGIRGYCRVLEAISNPEHEEHEEMLTWLGGEYRPDEFRPEAVRFENPKKRWRIAFAEEV